MITNVTNPTKAVNQQHFSLAPFDFFNIFYLFDASVVKVLQDESSHFFFSYVHLFYFFFLFFNVCMAH